MSTITSSPAPLADDEQRAAVGALVSEVGASQTWIGVPITCRVASSMAVTESSSWLAM